MNEQQFWTLVITVVAVIVFGLLRDKGSTRGASRRRHFDQ